MFFKKKKQEEEDYYCIAHFIENDADDEKIEEINDRILDEVDNVGVISEMYGETFSIEERKMLENCLPGIKFTYPGFAVIKIDPDRIKEETKKLEKQQKWWIKLFGTISFAEYDAAHHRAMYDFKRTLFFSTDVEETIAFLKSVENGYRHEIG